jgi:hypothetical protein
VPVVNHAAGGTGNDTITETFAARGESRVDPSTPTWCCGGGSFEKRKGMTLEETLETEILAAKDCKIDRRRCVALRTDCRTLTLFLVDNHHPEAALSYIQLVTAFGVPINRGQQIRASNTFNFSGGHDSPRRMKRMGGIVPTAIAKLQIAPAAFCRTPRPMRANDCFADRQNGI